MIKALAAALLFLSSVICLPAAASPIVADISNYRIHMDAGFSGTRMFLFGARGDAGDVIVVVRGPEKNYVIRKKEKFAGIWINRDRMKLLGVPDFYAVAASKPFEEIEQSAAFKTLGIGEEHLLEAGIAAKTSVDTQEFADAFLQHQYAKKLYHNRAPIIDFMGETLFKTVIEFPDTIPPGNYTAEIYLVSDGEIAGMQTIPIKVLKTGIDAYIYDHAHNRPVLYGISAIVIALCAGWFAGRLFDKT
jgi:uncharacterized protein (TIGR02186 family)